MPELTEHVKLDVLQSEIVKTRSIILVDGTDNPVLEFRAGENDTLQIMDKYGNVCAEIHIGQTPGKELRKS